MIPTARVSTFVGKIRKDPFGRIVIDTCESDTDHLRKDGLPEGDDRLRCRRLVEEAFEKFVGKEGTLTVGVVFTEG